MEYKEFFKSLPKWDGKDRVSELQQLVKIRATHLPPRGKRSNEADWFNFVVRQVVVSGKADAVIAGNEADELIAWLCPFAEVLIEEIVDNLLSVNEGSVLVAGNKTLHAIASTPRYKWTIAMEIWKIDNNYKSLDVKQLYAQILNR